MAPRALRSQGLGNDDEEHDPNIQPNLNVDDNDDDLHAPVPGAAQPIVDNVNNPGVNQPVDPAVIAAVAAADAAAAAAAAVHAAEHIVDPAEHIDEGFEQVGDIHVQGHQEATPIPTPTPSVRSERSNSKDASNILLNLIKGLSESSADSTSKDSNARAPDRFTGLDRTKFTTFLAQCKLVFRANPKKYKDDTKKVTYACSYLDGPAFEWYKRYLEAIDEPDWFDSWELFKDELTRNFGPKNLKATAERDIRELSMKPNHEVVTYITKFHTFANHLKWNDESLVAEFRRGLASRIKDQLTIAYPTVTDWTLRELEEAATTIDYRYWERSAERDIENRGTSTTNSGSGDRSKKSGESQRSYKSQTPRHDARSPSFTPKSTSSSKPKTSFDKLKGKTDQKDLPLDKHGHVTAEEKERRAKLGLCGYCGGEHKYDDCDKKKSYARALTTFTISEN